MEPKQIEISFDLLNDDVCLYIISFLSFGDLYTLSLTCKRMNRLSMKQVKSRRTVVCTSDIDSISEPKDSESVFNDSVAISVHYSKLISLFSDQLRGIQSLCLYDCEGVDDNNLHLVGERLKNLRCLWLSDVRISDDGLKMFFNSCKTLKELVLHRIDCDGLCFTSMPALQILRVRYCRNVRGNNFCQLSHVLDGSLEEFSYHSFPTTEFHFEEFANEVNHRFKRLKSLTLFVPSISCSISALNHFAFLEVIRLNLNFIGNIQQMNLLNNLRTVSFEFMQHISDTDLSQVVSRLPRVEDLSLILVNNSANFNETVNALKTLSNLKKLTFFFNVNENDSEECDERSFYSIFECATLREVKLGYLGAAIINSFIEEVIAVANRSPENKLEVQLFVRSLFDDTVQTPRNLRLKIFGNLDIETKYVEFKREMYI